ncbi:unnamed protein product [Adineta ricciae]|uniref:Nuclear pore complex protein n=1 Tax=Adineta ricciae TaxID=249248 RepID=A0A814LPW6_ADIRI|nr:unnamed protein product [Adineta ricciae]CAF1342659.1 unnamed protein product [Adineta ricciae]
MMNIESTVIDGSFCQPLESTRLTRTTNWSPNNDTSIRSSKSIPCITKSEQQLYKLYAQALADSEVTQDWSNWVEMMAINCQKCCSEAEISHPIAFRTGRQPQLSRNIRMLQVERDSWLLWNRARDTLNNTRQDLPDVIPGSSDQLIIEHHLLNNAELRMAKAVQGWLQTIKNDERYQTDLKMAMAKLEPKRIYWEKTCHFLKSSSYNAKLPNPYITSLDFDATHKQKRRLYDTDEQEENDLLQIVFSLLRVGEYSKAKNLCKSTGYHWLAAILCANELYHDENYYCSEASDFVYPVEGNQKRIQWTENMYELCMDMRLKLYERAIYGLLCGRIEALIPVCKTYADYLWAYTSCYIEQEIHQTLVYAHQNELSDVDKHRVFSTNEFGTHQLKMTTIFDEILASCPTHIRDEALSPFNQLEKYLILANYDCLCNSIISFLHSNEPNGSLLRFSTHICLFLYEQNHSDNFNQKNFIEILTTYIHHLIELEFKDLVCYYISKLPANNQPTLMATFLDTLANRQDKEYYLKQGFTYKIDIDTSLLKLAANQQREQAFTKTNTEEIISTNSKNLNENDQKQLESLKLLTTFLSTQTLDALRFANRICRYFLNDAKYEGIRTALSYFPHDIDFHTIEANNRQQAGDDLREFKAFGAYIAAIEAIQRWSEMHQKQNAASSTTRDDQAYLPIVIKAGYEVFDYPQGWLVDNTNVHQALPDHENRQAEMSILRHKCIPMLACNLLRIFDLSKNEQETFRLIVFLSDNRKQQLYSLFSKDTLQSVLSLAERAAERCLDRQQQQQTDDATISYFLK